ncbi:MAG: T9SS type A sorting domain-containing protein [Candidatus Latescibacterota bacterium]|nr:MAG: T9SS type A sorting domain-containing protein [Candidatus Latescibacterota bacterium]
MLSRRLLIGISLSTVFVLLCHAPDAAATGAGEQLFKLTASGAEGGDNFGISVGISGNTAIVGAHLGDAGWGTTGTAYLFDVSTGSQLFELTADDAAAGDQFGYSVAVVGNTAIVGARLDDEAGNNAGAAYLFDVTTGEQLFKLIADDTADGDELGCAVAISGNTAVVGAWKHNYGGSDAGAAYLFDVATGKQLRKLTAGDGAEGDRFGVSVGIVENTAVVGAHWNDDAGLNSGSAYLFDVATGEQLFKLTAKDGAMAEYFGYSVGINRTTVIVGAYWDASAGNRAGSAYLFDVETGNELFELTAEDAAPGDIFGYSVGINENTAIVGARFDDDGGSTSGSAYLFDIVTGEQINKLTANDATEFDHFGYSVSISEDKCIAGAPANDDVGAAYAFKSLADPPTSVTTGFTPRFVAHPNPFRSKTTISFDLPSSGFARLAVYDVRGRLVRTLMEGPQAAGSGVRNWEGYTNAGVRAPVGVYFVRLETGGSVSRSRKIVLMR